MRRAREEVKSDRKWRCRKQTRRAKESKRGMESTDQGTNKSIVGAREE